MKSAHPLSAWDRTRKNHLLTFPLCAVCETNEDLVVHHLRYRGKRGGSEISGDLVTLCAWHHNDLHDQHRRLRGSLVKFTLAYIETNREPIEMLDAVYKCANISTRKKH